MRTFVIISTKKNADPCENILKTLPKHDNIVVYMPEQWKNGDFQSKIECFRKENPVQARFYPDELRNWGSKLRNFISNELLERKTSGFVHVLEDNVQICGKVDVFLEKIEEMMTVFQLKSWFDTSCDQCNYIYQKYNPRLYVSIDEEEAKKRYPKTIAWCSNANTVWICYNMDKCSFEDIRFEEKFKISMYYIIEFLARRRNSKKPGQLDYMNYYPSIEEELGVFKLIDVKEDSDNSEHDMESESRIFQEMKVDNHPDMEFNCIMQDMRDKILEFEPKIQNEVEILT